MFKALWFKEWIKLRLYWLLLAAANLGFAAFLCLRLRHVFQLYDAVTIWSNWLFKGYLFFRPFAYVPLLTGTVLAGLQFFPEIFNRRLRLVLHLPLGEARAVAIHLVAGLGLLTLIYVAALVLFSVTAGVYFPAEFQSVFWLAVLPWVLAGYGAYLLTAAVLLEPGWPARIFYFLLGGGYLRLFYLDDFYNAYARVALPLVLWTAALFVVPLLAAFRFAKGKDSGGSPEPGAGPRRTAGKGSLCLASSSDAPVPLRS